MKKVYVVDLTSEEQTELSELLSKGDIRASRRPTERTSFCWPTRGTHRQEHSRGAAHHSPSTAERTRKRFVEGGLEHALNEAPRPGGERKLTGKQEAYLIALACSAIRPKAASGGLCSFWPTSSSSSGGGGLHKRGDAQAYAEKGALKPWRKQQWCIPEVGASSSGGWRTS